MEEKILAKGKFTSNYTGVVVEIFCGMFFAILFILSIALEMDIPFVTIATLGFVIFTIYGAITNYNLKYQELTITDKRVFGKLARKEIELPLDEISYVEAKGENGMTITTSGGRIVCQCCENRDEIINTLSSLLKKRNPPLFKNNNNDIPTTKDSSPTDEIRKYKELLDDGIITQEEFNSKKKELLNL